MRLISLFLLSLFLATVFCSEESSPVPTELEQTVNNLKAVFGCTAPSFSFDLSTLTSTADFSASAPDGAYTYYLNPCGVANTNPVGSKCAAASSTFCQKSSTGAGANLGTCTVGTGSPVVPTWTAIPNGVQVTYKNGDGCSSTGGLKTGVINFLCVPGLGRGIANGTVAENPTCTYTMNILTSFVCQGSGGEPSKGLSGGWIFIIILIVLIVLYIAVGCVYQRKKKGANGMESCPNIEFWRGLPILVKEGFTFTWSKLRGLCGKGEYTEVK